MRRSHALVALLALCAIAAAAGEKEKRHITLVSAESVTKTLSELFEAVHKEAEKAREAMKDAREAVASAVEEAVAKRRGEDKAQGRRLQTISTGIQNVQAFFEDMLGGGWRGLVPARWANSSFDWGKLGDFEYSSSLGDFLESHDLKTMANISSIHDLAHNMQEIEAAFCEPESFTPSEKVPATCTGPTVTIALVPKVCVLESKDKQIVCDPAKLVLTKSPGSCVHKYKSASSWVGKECKCSGGIGFSDELTIGGGEKTIPLIDIDIGYQAK